MPIIDDMNYKNIDVIFVYIIHNEFMVLSMLIFIFE
jgi:hypothetical protein